MHISPIMQVTATKSLHIIIQELMNLFCLGEFFHNPFGSDVISPNQLCKCVSVQVLHGQSTCSGTMNLNRLAPAKYIMFR